MSDITERGPAYGLLDLKVLKNISDTITPIDLLFSRVANVEPQVTTLTFEGDEESEELDLISMVRVTVEADKQDMDALQQIFGKTKVTSISGEEWSMWFGDVDETAGVEVGLQYDVVFKDQVGGASETLRYTYPKGILKAYRPGTAQYQSKHTMTLQFSFKRETTDLKDVALSGVPTRGAIYRIAKLT